MYTRFLLIAFAFLCLNVTACKKKDNHTTTCRITKSTVNDSSGGSPYVMGTSFSYLGDYLSRYITDDNFTADISRTGSLITAIITQPPATDTTFDTVQLDAAGFVVSRRSMNNYFRWSRSFGYNTQHVLQYIALYTNDTLNDSVTYAWNNGDCISEAHTSSGSTINFTYYPDIPASAGDWITFANWVDNYGGMTIKNAHAVKTVSYGTAPTTTTLYSYGLSNGNITSSEIKTVSVPDGIIIEKTNYTYTYDCK